MNTSQFMDKQIMDLSAGGSSLSSQNKNEFIDLMNPQENHLNKKEEIMASYDFQPLRPIVASQSPPNLDETTSVGVSRSWNSADSNTNISGVRNYGSLESIEPAKVILEKDHNVNDAGIVLEIDRTMKKHADNLLHALEGVSARLSQLESRTRHLENSVDDLKVSVGNNAGSTDGKMRQLENILREVQTGVQDIRDNQGKMEVLLQFAKMQMPKVEQQPGAENTGHIDSMQQVASTLQQSHHQFPPPAALPPSVTLPPPNAPSPPPPQLNLPSQIQLPNQYPQNQVPSVPQREPYFPPAGQTPQEAQSQHYQLVPTQQLQPPPPAAPTHQQYQPAPHPQFSQPPQQPQQHPSLPPTNPSPQLQPPLSHHPEEMPYAPAQTFPPSIRQPPSRATGGAPSSQEFYGAPSHMYDPPSSRSNPGFPSGYGPPTGTNEPYSYSGSPSQYGGGPMMKPLSLPSSGMPQGGGSGYPQLPTARILPQALPTASGVSSGSGSAGPGNRVPIDDVIDKVTTMGFTRDHVRATVRKLIENGQSVDLNVVLDKLMNDGEVPAPKGWFGR